MAIGGNLFRRPKRQFALELMAAEDLGLLGRYGPVGAGSGAEGAD